MFNSKLFSSVLNEKGRVQRDELVTAFCKCGLCSDGKLLYGYDQEHGCWSVLGHETNRRLREMIPGYLQAKISSTLLASVVDDLVENPKYYVNFREKMQPYILNMRQSALDLLTGQKVERSSEDYFDYYVNADLLDARELSLANAPCFQNFLRTSLATYEVPERAKLLLQIIGIAISSITGLKKMVVAVGPSGSGKSLFLRFIEHVVGRKHCSVVSFQDMNSRFRLFDLANARVNLCHEVQNSRIKSLDVIKKVIANEPFLVERKGIDATSITPIAKLISAANCIPSLGEGDNGAVIARMLLILFPNSISVQEKDPELLQKLIVEKDVIITLAIKELRSLIQSNFKFVIPEPEKSYLATYAQTENSVKAFAKEECIVRPDTRVHYTDLLKAYKRYCSDNNFRSLPEMDVKQFFLGQTNTKSKKFRFNGRNLWGLEGIGLKSNTFTQGTERADQEEGNE